MCTAIANLEVRNDDSAPLWLLEPVDGLGGETKSKTWALTPGPGGDLIEDLGTHSRTWWGPTRGLGPTCNPV